MSDGFNRHEAELSSHGRRIAELEQAVQSLSRALYALQSLVRGMEMDEYLKNNKKQPCDTT